VVADLDTLLIALYVELTDRSIPSLGFARSGPGQRPAVTDAELVCLAVAQEQAQKVAVAEQAVGAMSSRARRGLRYQAIGEREMSR
jgi:hypothetical protein